MLKERAIARHLGAWADEDNKEPTVLKQQLDGPLAANLTQIRTVSDAIYSAVQEEERLSANLKMLRASRALLLQADAEIKSLIEGGAPLHDRMKRVDELITSAENEMLAAQHKKRAKEMELRQLKSSLKATVEGEARSLLAELVASLSEAQATSQALDDATYTAMEIGIELPADLRGFRPFIQPAVIDGGRRLLLKERDSGFDLWRKKLQEGGLLPVAKEVA